VIRINDTGPQGDSTVQLTSPAPSVASYMGAYDSTAYPMDAFAAAPDSEIQTQRQFNVGSGVVVNDSGVILTAYHVVERATTIDITFADGTEAGASLVAVVPDNNIAVLQADTLPDIFAPATLGNPGSVRIGDDVYAVGNPLGLAGSISAGIVSGLDRSYTHFPGAPPLERLIQFDSAVNLGSAGGPLLNRDGEVVGIVVGPVNPTAEETFIGIGFAVRIDVAGSAAGAPEL
jgi:S1-C subfamily serine protease